MERILGDFNWVQGLARHLADDVGEDLAQEAWLAALRSPPQVGMSTRPWFARVLRNLAHVGRRNARRRQQRETDFQLTLLSSATAVDEAYERLELHRFVAEAVMALEPDLRTVVVLRYFGGLDSSRIGALVGSPSGTVRRRLMLARVQLRSAMDARFDGKRGAWVGLILPGLPSKSTTLIAAAALLLAQGKTKLMTAIGVTTIFLLLLGVVLWRVPSGTPEPPGGGPPQTASGSDERDPPGGKRPAPASRSGPAAFLTDRPEDLTDCRRTLSSLSQELRARENEAIGLVPRAAFESGAPNPALLDQLAPQVDRIFAGGGSARQPAYHLECRAWACRLAVIVSYENTGDVGPWLQTLGTWLPRMKLENLKIEPPSPMGVAGQWGSTKPTRDVLARRKLEESVFFFGAPPGAPAQPVATEPPPPSPGSLDTCRGELDAIRERLRRVLTELAGHRPLAAIFVAGAETQGVAAEVQVAIDRRLGPGAASVTCQGGVCRLRFPRPPDTTVQERVRTDPELGSRIRKHQLVGRDLFLTIGENGQKAISRLLEPTRAASFFAGCPDPDRPGSALLRILVPSTGSANDHGVPGRASVRLLGGSLGETPAGQCLFERVAAVVTSQDLPEHVGGGLRFESWTWEPGQPPALAQHP